MLPVVYQQNKKMFLSNVLAKLWNVLTEPQYLQCLCFEWYLLLATSKISVIQQNNISFPEKKKNLYFWQQAKEVEHR